MLSPTKKECDGIKQERRFKKRVGVTNQKKQIELMQLQLANYQSEMQIAKKLNNREKMLSLLNTISILKSQIISNREDLTKSKQYGYNPTPIMLEYNYDRQLLKMQFDYKEHNQTGELVPQ